jgi:hypothetical protein
MSLFPGKGRVKRRDDPEAPFFGFQITVKEETHVKRTAFLTLLAVALFLPAARAQNESARSYATAAGKYGFTDTGTVVGVGPRSAIGILTLDAGGNVTKGKATASLNGDIARETFSGAYTVNPDCTGTITVDIFDQSGITKLFTITGDIVFDDNLQELRGIFTSVVLPDGTTHLLTVITIEGKRVFPPSGDSQ